jgi:F-type H+-transporting ATPase subunit c
MRKDELIQALRDRDSAKHKNAVLWCLAIIGAIAAIAAAVGIGKIGQSTQESIARQPESAGNLRTGMIIAAGMIEGAALFAIIVCFLTLVIK